MARSRLIGALASLAVMAGLGGAAASAHAAPVKQAGTAGLVKPAGFLSHDAAMKVAVRKANAAFKARYGGHQLRNNGSGCCTQGYSVVRLTEEYAGKYAELVGLYYECSRWFSADCGVLQSWYLGFDCQGCYPGSAASYQYSFRRACKWQSMAVEVYDPNLGSYIGLRIEVAGISQNPFSTGISGSQVTAEQVGGIPGGGGTQYLTNSPACT